MERMCLIVLVACIATFGSTRMSQAEEPHTATLSVRLVVSEKEALVGDGLAAKLQISNGSISEVQIAGSTVKPRYCASVQVKPPQGDWESVWYSIDPKSLTEQGAIRIPAGESWAEYGMVPVSTKRGHCFRVPGEYQIRGFVACVLGQFTSDVIAITVSERTPEELTIVGKENTTISLLLNSANIPDQTQWNQIVTLKSRIPSGANHRTLEFFCGLIGYRENGAVDGLAMHQAAAFKRLSKNLDGVRRDQLAILLANDARRMGRWQDVSELSSKLKDNCAQRQSLDSELARVIRMKGPNITP